MVYQNNYVLCILHNGQVLREVNGEVYLPFDSEYVIRVKNKSSVRCGITIKVDGSYIHPPNVKLIVPACGTLDLERMMVDGNMESGPRLKFVSVDHPEVADPTNCENGVVEVSVYKEVVRFTQTWIPSWRLDHSGTCDHLSRGDWVTNSSSTYSCSTSNVGATIPGSTSDQSFQETNVELEPWPSATLRLTLRGIQENKALYVKDTRYKYCSQCGKKCRFKDKFCSRCGVKLS